MELEAYNWSTELLEVVKAGVCGGLRMDPSVVWVIAEDFPGEQDSVSRQKSSGDCVLASLKEVSAVSYDGSSSSSDLKII